MRSSFFELNVAMSGLFIARGNLDTVSHNVANASTPGYSRQYVEQRASRPLTYYDGKGMIGTGAEIYGLSQVRNFYLDKRYWAETPVLGEFSAKKTQVDVMERVLNEMSTTGLSSQFNDFFKILEDLTTTSGDTTYRTNLLTSASSITTFFGNTYETLKKQQADINGEIKVITDTINSLGIQITALNKQITTYELDGSHANDLRDQRARLVDKLSSFVNVDVREVEQNKAFEAGMYPEPEDRNKSQKKYVIFINGHEFVNDTDLSQLECRPRLIEDSAAGRMVASGRNAEDNLGMYDIFWKNTGSEFDMYNPHLSGQLKGLIDLRDGNNGNFARFTTLDNYNASGILTLEIDPKLSKVDLPNSGRIKSTDNVTGVTTYYEYTNYSYDPSTQKATFEIIKPSPSEIPSNAFAGKTVIVGETTDYKGITYYMNKLNELVRTYVTAINEGKYRDGTKIPDVIGHVDGYDLYGEKTDKLLYTYKRADGTEVKYGDADYSVYNFTAQNVFINSEIIGDNRLFGASQEATAGKSDNRVALSFLKIRSSESLFKEGSLPDFINGMTGELAIDGAQATRFEKNYTDVTSGIDNQRISVSGVNINEEMINMIKFQQQYQACAKLVNVIDGIYDTLVNRLGM